MTTRIPVASVDLSGNEEAYVVDAIRSTWISSTGAWNVVLSATMCDARFIGSASTSSPPGASTRNISSNAARS